MGRKKLEKTPIRAERLRILREREGKTQAEFAVLVGYQDQRQISDMERGIRRVNDDACKAIIRAFPEYRMSWLVGNDELMTRSDAVSWVKDIAAKQDDALRRAITDLFISADIELETVEENGTEVAYLTKDGIRVHFTDEMVESVTNEVASYFDYLLYKLVR